MIYAIVAVDDKNGLAIENGLPWDLPTDRHYFRDKVKNQTILMGSGTYKELKDPLSAKKNLVATSQAVRKAGFIAINHPTEYLDNVQEDVWVIGGAGLFKSVWDKIDILYLTKIQGDFKCTKFLPEYADSFTLQYRSGLLKENGIKFRFEVWNKINSSRT